MFCPQCGTRLPDGAKFCGQCGTAVRAAANPAPAPQRPAGAAPQPQTPYQAQPQPQPQRRTYAGRGANPAPMAMGAVPASFSAGVLSAITAGLALLVSLIFPTFELQGMGWAGYALATGETKRTLTFLEYFGTVTDWESDDGGAVFFIALWVAAAVCIVIGVLAILRVIPALPEGLRWLMVIGTGLLFGILFLFMTAMGDGSYGGLIAMSGWVWVTMLLCAATIILVIYEAVIEPKPRPGR